MQKAIENFIDIQLDKKVSLDDIEDEIHKVEKAEVRKARKKQYRDWRNLNGC